MAEDKLAEELGIVHHATLTHDGVKPTGLKPPRRKGLLSRLLSRKKAA